MLADFNDIVCNWKGDGVTSDSNAWQGNGAGFAKELAVGLSTNGTLTSLNISSNNIGELLLPEGWSKKTNYQGEFKHYKHTDGRKQEEAPEGSEPVGALALINAIKNNVALEKLDTSNNNIEQGEVLLELEIGCNSKGIELDSHESGNN